ncbi:MAG: hypothetical protein JWM78_2722 [Verrucomicrobiaceae bacterium]|nr:hypothetical protein [Verrucomicrobiaceae bacterium]
MFSNRDVMAPVLPHYETAVAALLAGSTDDLRAFLAQVSPKQGAAPLTATVSDLFWARWCRHAGLHSVFITELAPLHAALLKLDPADWMGLADHPLWPLLDLCRQASACYQPELGRAAEKIVTEWRTVLAPLTESNWLEALQRAQDQWQQEQQKLVRLEQRVIDNERGQLRTRRAQQIAALALNRALAGQRLSVEILRFVQLDWYRELQWCVLQFGESSPEWQQRIELTQRLILSLQDPGADSEARQRLYSLIPTVAQELRDVMLVRAQDNQLLEQHLALIQSQHVALLKSQPLASVAATPIASDDPWLSSAMTLSRDLLQRAADLQVGSSYRVRDGDTEIRVKLVLKMEDADQLLFVNRLGIKALQKSFEEFAYWLAADIAQPLPPAADSPLVLRELLGDLLTRNEQQTRARAELRQRQEFESQRRLAAREKAIIEARQLAEAKEQALIVANEKAREQELQRRRELVEEHYRGDDNQRLRLARQTAVTMVIGNWVELYDEVGRAQRLRLAVKLSASGKLIFVDREGVRCAEYERDVFAACLLNGSVRLLDQGPQFEDTLARVVDSLRRDRANRE